MIAVIGHSRGERVESDPELGHLNKGLTLKPPDGPKYWGIRGKIKGIKK